MLPIVIPPAWSRTVLGSKKNVSESLAWGLLIAR